MFLGAGADHIALCNNKSLSIDLGQFSFGARNPCLVAITAQGTRMGELTEQPAITALKNIPSLRTQIASVCVDLQRYKGRCAQGECPHQRSIDLQTSLALHLILPIIDLRIQANMLSSSTSVSLS